jgi:hypothetical protein
MKKKIKVVLSAIWYPMTTAIWFWKALERRKDIDLIVVGPFTGDYIPWNYGMRLPQRYVRVPDIALPPQIINQSVPSSIVECQLPWIPDLWIQVDAGWHFSNKPKEGIVALVQTDPHVIKQNYRLPISYSDLNFCMQLQYSESREIYLPYAYDKTVHYPMDIDKIYDACLVGIQYQSRNGLVERLQSHGLNVKYEIGLVFDEYRLAYNQSKIALNWSTLDDIPSRFFEGMSMKLPLVSNIVPDIEKLGFIEGTDYLGFRTLDEADEKVKQLLVDEGLRCWVAENGYRKVKKHTWDARIKTILEEAKLI